MCDAEQQAEDRIRHSALRRTSARVAVLKELIAAEVPLSHAEMTDRLASLGIDQATVYRNLNDLAEAGLLVRAELGDHVWRFEYRHSDDPHQGVHPHFVCTECGSVACLDGVDLTASTKRRTNRVGRVTQVLLKGQCVDCDSADEEA
jgi:Fur family transcriptional regulator, ferric uptake regulator